MSPSPGGLHKQRGSKKVRLPHSSSSCTATRTVPEKVLSLFSWPGRRRRTGNTACALPPGQHFEFSPSALPPRRVHACLRTYLDRLSPSPSFAQVRRWRAGQPDPNPPISALSGPPSAPARVLKISPISADDSFPVGEFGAALRCWGGRQEEQEGEESERKESGRATYAKEEAAARDVCGSKSAGCRNPYHIKQ